MSFLHSPSKANPGTTASTAGESFDHDLDTKKAAALNEITTPVDTVDSISGAESAFAGRPAEKMTWSSSLKNWLSFVKNKHFWIILIHGQILSFCITGTNIFSSYLAKSGNSIPAFQSLFVYVILNIVFTSYTLYKIGFKNWAWLCIKDGWKFFLLAFVDVQGNYFVVKGYAYTNLLSAQILGMWSIPVVLFLSFFFLKVRYKWTQLLGVVVCLGGLALVIASDLLTHKGYAAPNVGKGDAFIIIGATCYGFSNTFEEFFVSQRPMYEVIGQLGFWATFINGVQTAIFERNSMKNAEWSGAVGGYIAGFTVLMLIIYTTTPILFRMSSAAFYNMSILTANFWGLIIGIRVFGYYVYWLYPIGFTLSLVGIIIYYLLPGTLEREINKPWVKDGEEFDGVGLHKHSHARAQDAENQASSFA
ncbi:DUF914-domain-containing protein [Nadsonia fulvescens var. elongata DSM 6958]|uniref:DUF914-domain-containing protein n=1 Tax=Nadsonia fulvescens var. elongata DSM 6958 TaxID=857566 RepID=A0A1E3PJU6_9ASCO|nr:DUF914-domain-containing protein [Nadsonia fulvescens var. elongata DSM 6958]